MNIQETPIQCQSQIDMKNNPSVTPYLLCSIHTNMSQVFADYLRSQLEARNMTPAELARRAGITKQNISRILNQTPHPLSGALPKVKVQTVEAIAKALGVPVDEAREAAGYSTQEPGKPQTLADLLSRLKRLGIDNLHFANEDALRAAGPDELQEVLDAVKFAVEYTLQKRLSPPPQSRDD